jgi:hypothetical protein
MLKQFVRIGWKGQPAYNEHGTLFVQKTRGPKIGVMVALDKQHIGWSLISEKEDLSEKIVEKRTIDTPKGKKTIEVGIPIWNSKRIWDYGTRLAIERAKGEQPTPEVVPNVIKRELTRFKRKIDRLQKPF